MLFTRILFFIISGNEPLRKGRRCLCREYLVPKLFDVTKIEDDFWEIVMLLSFVSIFLLFHAFFLKKDHSQNNLQTQHLPKNLLHYYYRKRIKEPNARYWRRFSSLQLIKWLKKLYVDVCSVRLLTWSLIMNVSSCFANSIVSMEKDWLLFT